MSSLSCSIDQSNEDIESISVNSKTIAKNDQSNRLSDVIGMIKKDPYLV